MEERGYVAEALLERLRDDAVAFRLIGDPAALPDRAPAEIELAVLLGLHVARRGFWGAASQKSPWREKRDNAVAVWEHTLA